jgi:gas vesicle structural protein
MKELTAEDASLLELVDRLLNKGVVLAGEATISVAGVDLIYLGLNVVLAAVETIEKAQERRAS